MGWGGGKVRKGLRGARCGELYQSLVTTAGEVGPSLLMKSVAEP